MAMMKELIFPKIKQNDKLVLHQIAACLDPAGELRTKPPITAKVAEVNHMFCAIDIATGVAIEINGEYTFFSAPDLMLALSRKYRVYQED